MGEKELAKMSREEFDVDGAGLVDDVEKLIAEATKRAEELNARERAKEREHQQGERKQDEKEEEHGL